MFLSENKRAETLYVGKILFPNEDISIDSLTVPQRNTLFKE